MRRNGHRKDPIEIMPAHDIPAEKSVLGSVMTDRAAAKVVLAMLEPEDFYPEGHRTLFRVMQELAARGEHIDHVTLGTELGNRDLYDASGGVEYVCITLPESVPLGGFDKRHAEIVKEKSILRQDDAEIKRIADSKAAGNGYIEKTLKFADKIKTRDVVNGRPQGKPQIVRVISLKAMGGEDERDNVFKASGESA